MTIEITITQADRDKVRLPEHNEMLRDVVNKERDTEHSQDDMTGGHDLIWALKKSKVGPDDWSILVRLCRRYVTARRQRYECECEVEALKRMLGEGTDPEMKA